MLLCDIIKQGKGIRPGKAYMAFFAVMLMVSFMQPAMAEKKSARKSSRTQAAVEEKAPEKPAASDEKAGDRVPAAVDGQKPQAAADDRAEGEGTGVPDREYTDEDFRPKTDSASYIWDIIKTIFILGLMVGGFYYFFRFITKKTGIQIHGEDVVKTLAIVPLAQNKFIHVVDLAGRVLVLGVADSGINLITEVTSRDEIDRIRLLGSRTKPMPEGGFQEYIRQQIGKVVERINEKRNSGGTRPARTSVYDRQKDEEVDLDYLHQQRSRLKDLNRYGDE